MSNLTFFIIQNNLLYTPSKCVLSAFNSYQALGDWHNFVRKLSINKFVLTFSKFMHRKFIAKIIFLKSLFLIGRSKVCSQNSVKNCLLFQASTTLSVSGIHKVDLSISYILPDFNNWYYFRISRSSHYLMFLLSAACQVLKNKKNRIMKK
jgi:hypothetical protein